MPPNPNRITLERFGANPRLALKAIALMMRDRGWIDVSGAALTLTNHLDSTGADGTSISILMSKVPSRFLLDNSISKSDFKNSVIAFLDENDLG